MLIVTNENVNGIVDYSVAMVNSIIKDRTYPGKLKNVMYLAFISYIIEYGYDKIETIYKTFASAKFTMTSFSIDDYIKSRNDLPIEYRGFNEQVSMGSPAVTLSLLKGEIHNPIFIDEIVLSTNMDMGLLAWIDAFIHEINHLYTSQNNRLFFSANSLFIRNGLLLFEENGNKPKEKGRQFNEYINSLQTEDLVANIIELCGLKINNPFVASMIENIKFGANKKYITIGYTGLLPPYRELYNNKQFKDTLAKCFDQGDISIISESFDSCTENGAYEQLLELSDRAFNVVVINQQGLLLGEIVKQTRDIIMKYSQNTESKRY